MRGVLPNVPDQGGSYLLDMRRYDIPNSGFEPARGAADQGDLGILREAVFVGFDGLCGKGFNQAEVGRWR
jgi:hypothetical protein